MNNKEYYKDAFNEIHVSAAVLRKVRNMSMEKRTIQRQSKLKYAVSMMAVLALCLIASNGICYAATGNTWVEKVVLYINGEKTETNMTMHKDGNKIWGETTYDIDEDDTMHVSMASDNSEAENTEVIGGTVVREEDKVYLLIGDNMKKIDITDDFADGECKGTFDLKGKTYQYEITGTVEECGISIYCD